MLEIRKTSKPEGEPAEYRLFIAGIVLEDADIQAFGDDHISSISTNTQEATNKLLEYSLVQLIETSCYSLRLMYEVRWNEAVGQIWPSFSVSGTRESNLYLLFNRVSCWRRPYTFEEYFAGLIQESRISPLPYG